jgi:hypothetical protein
VTEVFPKKVQKLFMVEVTLSPDLYLLPNNKNTILVDSSSEKAAEQQTDLEIERANVIVLVYDANNFDS